ncbi:MAG TPA: methyltransferase domain-containing protein [Verrucomicrobiae bacterium]|nr:methyltransferase domain-containing protein [Verrucomicrobiae bacterium]
MAKEIWDGGAAYESYVGRWSRLVAREFLGWLNVPPGSRWLDVGCGCGALTQTIRECAMPETVHGVDRSPEFITFARQQMSDERVRYDTGDAKKLSAKTSTYDAVVSALALNFFPDPPQAVAEMVRVARPGGLVAAYVWDYAGRMELMRHFWNAAVALDPSAGVLDEGRRFPLCQPEPLRELFQSAGLDEAEIRAIDIATKFENFDDYWKPFLGGQGPAPSYAMALGEEQRAALGKKIRATLPIAEDGSIQLVARAWAARGVRG